MISQTGQEIITIDVMPNISRNKGNQTMKFGQFIEYNIIYVFLEKSYIRLGGKVVAEPFIKNKNRAYIWMNSLKCYKCFVVSPSRGLPNYVKTKVLPTCFYLKQSFFKNRRRFEEKCFSHYILLTDQISLPDSFFFLRYSVILFFAQSLT